MKTSLDPQCPFCSTAFDPDGSYAFRRTRAVIHIWECKGRPRVLEEEEMHRIADQLAQTEIRPQGDATELSAC